ncbi:hypothetical protein C8Q77DRAFT_1140736 [Trametes polyzona]|nr:hypothetical protein C8Q77DRAFT_1140736 [Trametes polyzona]
MGPSKKTAVSDPSSSKQASNGTASQKQKSKRPQHKKHPAPPPASSNALPGVQKIKAALRQTRRLLAKDTLAADVRVATERRLKSLEADLAKAERARLERTMATRYHKIKFFERQKVVRKLHQTKRKLASEEGPGDDREELEARLAELRVDLNYILHYPKTKKYISLFPPEVRQAKGQSAAETARQAKEKSDTDKQREEIRTWMREQMDGGALSWEPEVELEKSERKAGVSAKAGPSMEVPLGKKAMAKGKKGDHAKSSTAKSTQGVAGDDFFDAGEDEDEEEEKTSASDSEGSDGGGGGSEEDVDMDED